MKEPKDLGVKMGTKEEAFWKSMKKKVETDIENAQREIEINKHILILADTRISEEKEKFK